jgi:Leucine-rich repeat (LRR) protein
MELTPDKIYKDYLNNNLDKHSAAKLLLSLIENSENEKVRTKCVKQIGRIGIKDNQTFNILENLLISDSNEIVRNTAALTLKDNYFEKLLEPMKWALIHEHSPLCLNTIYSVLIKIVESFVKSSNPLAKSILFSEVKKIRKKEFKLGFEIMCETKRLNSFTKKDLGEILINYFTILLIEKTYWRVKFKIENCKIIELDFIFKGLTNLPAAIEYLKQLKILILRYNQIIYLPDWLGFLNSLEELNINVNNLNKLPESIGNLTSLKELHLWKNELKSLPSTIGQLNRLETLNLRLNQIKTLPISIGYLSTLKELDLHDNQLKSLPDSLKKLKSLEKLILSWNQIEKIPESIGCLSSLRILDLERNEIVDIPNELGHLLSLEYLNLSDNKIESIPETIGNLHNLKSLNLSRNEISYIPKSLSSLSSLKELYLKDNNLDRIPKNLKNLENRGLKIYL